MRAAELRQEMRQRCVLHGVFQLRSGKFSDVYFDKYRLISEPHLLTPICARLSRLLDAENAQNLLIAGIELGGVPLATQLSSTLGLPMVMVRKQAKTYGTQQQIEGRNVTGQRLVLVEDVISTGGAVQDALAALEAAGARVLQVLCVLDRRTGASAGASIRGVPVQSVFRGHEMGL